MSKAPHIPVLLDSVLDSFSEIRDGAFVDCTIGYAGHSSAMLERYPQIHLIGIDRDTEALEFSKDRLSQYGKRVELIKGSFSSIVPVLAERNISGLLADFGVSSLQLDSKDRGFSFRGEALDMRMDQSIGIDAKTVVNEYTSEKLEYIFKHYGEISQAKKLADAIIKCRMTKEISNATELSNIVAEATWSKSKIHPSTLAFQAIRIEVNDELGEIERMLDSLEEISPSGAIVSLITFHSLEDRLVKNRFKKWSMECICPPELMRCECGKNNSKGKVINKKPIIASIEESKINPRSRSAKLRSFRFKERNL